MAIKNFLEDLLNLMGGKFFFAVFFVFIIVLTSLPALSVEMIIATVDKDELYLGDAVKLNLSISDPNLKIQFPQETSDYKVVANSTSSSFQIINGQTSQNKTISFVIQPLRVGKIKLPEAAAFDGTNHYKSQNLFITVLAGNKNTKSITNQAKTQSPTVNNNEAIRNNVFAKVVVNKTNPYVNEQIHLSLKIYHIGNLMEMNPNTLQLPLKDFVRKIDTNAKEFRETVNGREYLVYQLDYTLFPLKSGEITIPAHEIEGVIMEDAPLSRGSFDPFRVVNPFIIKKKINFKTNSLSITVKPLPVAGQPTSYSGYVGDIAVNHKISSYEIRSGSAITVTTKIYGSGSSSIFANDLVKESKQYSLFKDKEDVSEELTNSILYFEKTINTAIVPNKDSGRVVIETLPVISFNPKTGKFEEHGAETFEITILPGEEAFNSGEIQYKPSHNKAKKTIQPQILNASKDQIQDWHTNPLKYLYIFCLVCILNLIYWIFNLYNRFGFRASSSDLSNNKSVLKQIKKTYDLVELSTLFKDFINKNLPTEINLELKQQIDDFIYETDRLNYSGDSYAVNDLTKLKEKASDLIKVVIKLNGRRD
jgi:hypothetical protein